MEKIVLEKTITNKRTIITKSKYKELTKRYFNKRQNIVQEDRVAEHKVFTLKNNTIRCELVDDYGDTIVVGKASCHPEDKFDYSIGIKLAEIRAYKKLYNMLEKEEINRL